MKSSNRATPAVLFERLLFVIGITLVVGAAFQALLAHTPGKVLLGDGAGDDLAGAYVSAMGILFYSLGRAGAVGG